MLDTKAGRCEGGICSPNTLKAPVLPPSSDFVLRFDFHEDFTDRLLENSLEF